MGRLMCIDYGRKRCGVAVTDELRIVATGLATVPAGELLAFIKNYVSANRVDAIIVGKPTTMGGEPSESMAYIVPFVRSLERALPDMPVRFYDERFTSALAHRSMIDGGLRQKARRDKALVDRMAATIILNDYLQSQYKDL